MNREKQSDKPLYIIPCDWIAMSVSVETLDCDWYLIYTRNCPANKLPSEAAGKLNSVDQLVCTYKKIVVYRKIKAICKRGKVAVILWIVMTRVIFYTSHCVWDGINHLIIVNYNIIITFPGCIVAHAVEINEVGILISQLMLKYIQECLPE